MPALRLRAVVETRDLVDGELDIDGSEVFFKVVDIDRSWDG
jgi:hypothetical protein